MPYNVLDQLREAKSNTSNDQLLSELDSIEKEARSSSNALGALQGVVSALTAGGKPLAECLDKIVESFKAVRSVAGTASSSMADFSSAMNGAVAPVGSLERGLASLTKKIGGLSSQHANVEILPGLQKATRQVEQLVKGIERLQNRAANGVSIQVAGRTGQAFAEGGTVRYTRRNSDIAMRGGRFSGSRHGDREIAFVNAGEAIITERAIKSGARQSGMSVGAYVNSLNRGDLRSIKRGRSFARGGYTSSTNQQGFTVRQYGPNGGGGGGNGGGPGGGGSGGNPFGRLNGRDIQSISDAIVRIGQDAVESFDRATRSVGPFGDMLSNSNARAAILSATLIVLGKSIKDAGERTAGFFKKQAELNIAFDKAGATVQAWSGMSQTAFKQVADSLSLTRDQMRGMGEEMAKFSSAGFQSAEMLAGMATNMKELFGAVDMNVIKEAVDAFKNLPQEQLGAFAAPTSFGNEANALTNVVKSGNLEKVIDMQLKGAFGEREGMAQLSDKDRAVVEASERTNQTLDDIDKTLNDWAPKWMATSSQYTKIIGKATGIITAGMALLRPIHGNFIRLNRVQTNIQRNTRETVQQSRNRNRSVNRLANQLQPPIPVIDQSGGGGGRTTNTNWQRIRVRQPGGQSPHGPTGGNGLPTRNIPNGNPTGPGGISLAGAASFASMGFALGGQAMNGGVRAYGQWKSEKVKSMEIDYARKNNPLLNEKLYGSAKGKNIGFDHDKMKIDIEKKSILEMNKFATTAANATAIIGSLAAAGATVGALLGAPGGPIALGTAALGAALGALAGAAVVTTSAIMGYATGAEKAKRNAYQSNSLTVDYTKTQKVDNWKSILARAIGGKKLGEKFQTEEVGTKTEKKDTTASKIVDVVGKTIATTKIGGPIVSNIIKILTEKMSDSLKDENINPNAQKDINLVNSLAQKHADLVMQNSGKFQLDKNGNIKTGTNEKGEKTYQTMKGEFVTAEQFMKDQSTQLIHLNKHLKNIEGITKHIYSAYTQESVKTDISNMQAQSMMGGNKNSFWSSAQSGMAGAASGWRTDFNALQKRKSGVLSDFKSGKMNDAQTAVALNSVLQAELDVHKNYLDQMSKLVGKVGEIPTIIEHEMREKTRNAFASFQAKNFIGTGTTTLAGATTGAGEALKDLEDAAEYSRKELEQLEKNAEQFQSAFEGIHDEIDKTLKGMNGGKEYDEASKMKDQKIVDAIEKAYAENGVNKNAADIEKIKELLNSNDFESIQSDVENKNVGAETVMKFNNLVVQTLDNLKNALENTTDKEQKDLIEEQIKQFEAMRTQNTDQIKSGMGTNLKSLSGANSIVQLILNADQQRLMANAKNKVYKEFGGQEKVEGAQTRLSLSKSKDNASDFNVANQKMLSTSREAALKQYQSISNRLVSQMNDVFNTGAMQFNKVIIGALKDRQWYEQMGSAGNSYGQRIVEQQLKLLEEIDQGIQNQVALLPGIGEKLAKSQADIDKSINPNDKNAAEKKKYLNFAYQQAGLQYQLAQNPMDKEAETALVQVMNDMKKMEQEATKNEKGESIFAGNDIQDKLAEIGSIMAPATSIIGGHTERAKALQTSSEMLKNMIAQSLNDASNQLARGGVSSALAAQQMTAKTQGIGAATAQTGDIIKLIQESTRTDINSANNSRQQALDEADKRFAEMKAFADKITDQKQREAEYQKAENRHALDKLQIEQEYAQQVSNILEKKSKDIESSFAVSERYVKRMADKLDTMKDFASTVGAPYEMILQIDKQRIDVEMRQLSIEKERLNALEDSNEDQEKIEEQKLKYQQQAMKVVKMQYGMQHDFMSKLLGKITGTFQDIGGIFNPAYMASKIFGQGYMKNPNGAMSRAGANAAGGYAERQAAMGAGMPGASGAGYMPGMAGGGTVGATNSRHMSFGEVQSRFGTHFNGPNGLERRSPQDTQLALLQTGETVIPVDGSRRSAQSLGVPEQGLADAYRSGDLLGYIMDNSDAFGDINGYAGGRRSYFRSGSFKPKGNFGDFRGRRKRKSYFETYKRGQAPNFSFRGHGGRRSYFDRRYIHTIKPTHRRTSGGWREAARGFAAGGIVDGDGMELALLQNGEQIIPANGSMMSAQSLGVSDMGLADAYMNGNLFGYLSQNSGVINGYANGRMGSASPENYAATPSGIGDYNVAGTGGMSMGVSGGGQMQPPVQTIRVVVEPKADPEGLMKFNMEHAQQIMNVGLNSPYSL